MDCGYLKSGECDIISGFCGARVAVAERTCTLCSQSVKPGPCQRNNITASAAIRYLKSTTQEQFERHIPEIRRYIECESCGQKAQAKRPDQQARNLLLRCHLSPGDILTMTAAVRSLHAAHPGRYVTAVDTSCPEIWLHNPEVVQMPPEDRQQALWIEMRYPSIHRSNQTLSAFLGGYTEFLAAQLGVDIPLSCNRPQLYLSHREQQQQICGSGYWIVNSGHKSCFPAKQWPVEYYQEVIRATRHRIQWVQIGQLEENHHHSALEHVLDLRGKTSLRQLFQVVHHAAGGLGPVTMLQHACAALEKPYLCLLGGREPVPWVQYPLQHTFHALGQLDCCRTAACWKSHVVQPEQEVPASLRSLYVGSGSVCVAPQTNWQVPVGQCMAMIKPEEVLAVLERFL